MSKVQLGVRVASEVRAGAVEKARLAGVSLNEWVEDTIRKRLKVEGDIAAQEPPLVGTIDEIIVDLPAAVLHPEATVTDQAVHPSSPQKFASNCSSGTYHWKHGLGNPCRSCGGETL